MKKIIKILSQLSLVGGSTLATVACNGNSFGGVLEPGKPSADEPEVKDRDYYLKLIAENQADIEDCKELLTQILNDQANDTNEDEEDEEDEYQVAINETTAEIDTYEAENCEYYYQIVLLRNNGEINVFDKAEAIKYLNKKINFLTDSIPLKEYVIKLHPDEYDENEINNINENIEQTKIIINNLEKEIKND